MHRKLEAEYCTAGWSKTEELQDVPIDFSFKTGGSSMEKLSLSEVHLQIVYKTADLYSAKVLKCPLLNFSYKHPLVTNQS